MQIKIKRKQIKIKRNDRGSRLDVGRVFNLFAIHPQDEDSVAYYVVKGGPGGQTTTLIRDCQLVGGPKEREAWITKHWVERHAHAMKRFLKSRGWDDHEGSDSDWYVLVKDGVIHNVPRDMEKHGGVMENGIRQAASKLNMQPNDLFLMLELEEELEPQATPVLLTKLEEELKKTQGLLSKLEEQRDRAASEVGLTREANQHLIKRGEELFACVRKTQAKLTEVKADWHNMKYDRDKVVAELAAMSSLRNDFDEARSEAGQYQAERDSWHEEATRLENELNDTIGNACNANASWFAQYNSRADALEEVKVELAKLHEVTDRERKKASEDEDGLQEEVVKWVDRYEQAADVNTELISANTALLGKVEDKWAPFLFCGGVALLFGAMISFAIYVTSPRESDKPYPRLQIAIQLDEKGERLADGGYETSMLDEWDSPIRLYLRPNKPRMVLSAGTDGIYHTDDDMTLEAK